MALRERIEQSIRRAIPTDLPALKRFQRETWAEGARVFDDARHRWLFEHNPCAQKSALPIWICEQNGQIIGQQAGVPYGLKVGDRSYRASWAADLSVRPAFRLHGIGPVLNTVFTRQNEFTTGIGLNDGAYTMFRRGGWLDLGFVPNYIRPLRLEHLLRRKSSISHRTRTAARLLQPALAWSAAALHAYRRCHGATLERIDGFNEEVDRVWEDASPHYPILAHRDLASRCWRFECAPDARRYEKYYLVVGGRVRGYVVLRMGQSDGVPVGRIIDFLCAPTWLLPLIALSVQRFLSSDAVSVQCRALFPGVRRLLWLGFVERPSSCHLMVLSGGRRDFGSIDLADARNWFVTMGEKDVDYRLE
jgi:hypothetical protein